ncbi:siderophore-interacting protein [Paracoccus aminophilus]|uniref:Siderophore-interacting protein n=1 Tax=Paracoccus aminophilus JCM 7686 TaxID=1367847 RepID=S5YFZ7_PARAH|nr:siderophore-interacting protein [Paracoccus aminophilus]AGT10388.1 siderophore-interacting protein [Paracoccus aminophilus JCM 7686]
MAQSDTETGTTGGKVLSERDHMGGLESVTLRVERIARPVPSVARVIGIIETQTPAIWAAVNVAIRIELEPGSGPRPVSRVYTLRSFDPETRRTEIDFVLHDDDTPAMRWLNAAGPGTEVMITGPRPHAGTFQRPGHPSAVFADETAVPALVTILAAWPKDAPGLVVVESADRAAFDELVIPAGVEARLILRAPDEPAGASGHLIRAAKALDPAQDWTIWAAGERVEMREIRSHFLAAGIARGHLFVEGYWKRGTSSTDIDRARLAHYEALVAAGKGLAEFEDSELAL